MEVIVRLVKAMLTIGSILESNKVYMSLGIRNKEDRIKNLKEKKNPT